MNGSPVASPRGGSTLRRLVARTLFPATLILATAAAAWAMTAGADPAFVSLAISLAVLALVAVTERLMPFEPDWNRSHGDLGADIGSLTLVAIGVEKLLAVLSPPLAVVANEWLRAQGLFGGGFPVHWPLLAQVLLLVLLADLAKYWFHRFGHEHPLGWRLHSVHHSVKRVYWLNGFRIHPLYHLINFATALLPWLCLGVSSEVLALYSVVLAVSAAFQHANIDLDNRGLHHVFNTFELHRWHHSRRLEESNANYGAVLVVWDLLFGSYRPLQPGRPETLGMVHEQGYPLTSYAAQLWIPFRTAYWRRIEQLPQ